MVSRRRFLFSSAAGVAGCRPRRGSGFPGYAFVTSQESEALAVVDLTAFAVARHIPLGASPAEVVANPTRHCVYALTPLTGALHEIDPRQLTVRRRVRIAQRPASMRLAPGGDVLWALCAEPNQIVRVALDRFQTDLRLPLPARPAGFDLTSDGRIGAVTHGAEGSVSFLDLAAGRVRGTVHAGDDTGEMRFRMDGAIALVADLGQRLICVLDTATGKLITSLQIAVKPEHFCFKPDGGEMFVTGEGMDAVVVVNPYYTEVAETVLVGRAPGAMAVSRSPQYLFVANPPGGDVTILDPEARRVVAVVAVGSDPSYVTLTPGDEYALVLNRRSGTMALIRPAAVVARRAREAALFTTIPVVSRPLNAAVLAV